MGVQIGGFRQAGNLILRQQIEDKAEPHFLKKRKAYEPKTPDLDQAFKGLGRAGEEGAVPQLEGHPVVGDEAGLDPIEGGAVDQNMSSPGFAGARGAADQKADPAETYAARVDRRH
ncbi:hypothetical protein IZ6_28400 [Terrihabitans soli]|uniref:Uncharacterized protein n=1 Tax=Terrihabitans soli TaxID=708113 RepID=A0A6S6QX14_9HYPH|nr:hypothetical protein IZ6_28400 [Terrihabitans soli]